MSEAISRETLNQLLNATPDQQRDALRRHLSSFAVRAGMPHYEFTRRWEAGELPDTPENASLSIEAYGLRQGMKALYPDQPT